MIYVASYCRVSTDKEDQANSFEAQQRYFTEYIDRQPDWELYRVYADEGITGTSTKKRAQFNRMILDAKLGKFSLILTKEVSRFSRNILDTIGFTRELKALGVGVIFMNDGINTLEPDAELRLSIMGSIAQEESRKTSSRVKWGQTRQMERGVVFGHSLLGYDVIGGKLSVNPEGAQIVRRIFRQYGVEGKGTGVIARELREDGLLTTRGNPLWRSSHIIKILRNEKYVGDLVQKKTYTPDYLTHAKKYNHGAEELICIRDHHEPIIDRELWNVVQSELKRRDLRGATPGHGTRYLFSGKIRCGVCGRSFCAKQAGSGSTYLRWCCASADVTHHSCGIGLVIRDDFASDLLQTVASALLSDTQWLADSLSAWARGEITRTEATDGIGTERLEQEIARLEQKKEAILDAFFSRDITKEEMRLLNRRSDERLEELRGALRAVRERAQLRYELSALPADVSSHVARLIASERSEPFYRSLLSSMTVYPDRRVILRLNLLPQKWREVLDSIADLRRRGGIQPCHQTPSVPTKGSIEHISPNKAGLRRQPGFCYARDILLNVRK